MSKIDVRIGSNAFPSMRAAGAIDAGGTIVTLLDKLYIPVPVRDNLNILLNDCPVPKSEWGRVKPKSGTMLTLSIVPKDSEILRMGLPAAASLAVGLLVPGVGGWALSTVTYGLTLWAANLLFPVPEKAEAVPSHSLTGTSNRIEQYGVVPKPYGRLRVYPPLAGKPITELQGKDQYIRVLYVVGYKPVKVSSFWIAGTPIGSGGKQDVTITVASGWDDSIYDDPFTMFSNDVDEKLLDKELVYVPTWRPAGMLAGPNDPGVIAEVTATNTTTISLDIVFPNGLYRQDGNDIKKERMDLHIRYRPKGATGDGSWHNVVPYWASSNVVRTFTDSELFQFLETLNSDLTTVVDGMEATESALRIISAVLGPGASARISQVNTLVDERLSKGNLDAGQTTTLTNTKTLLGRLRGVLDTATESISDISDTLAGFNDKLSIGLKVLNFVDTFVRFNAYIQNGAGQDLSTLPWYLRFIARKWDITHLFGEPPEGAFIVTTESNIAEALRKTIQWQVEPGQYEVQVRRTLKDTENPDVQNEVRLHTFRCVRTMEAVSQLAKSNLAFVGVRMKATEEFSGSLGEFSCLVETPLRYFDGAQWVDYALTDSNGANVSRNPAWVAYDAVSCSASQNPVPVTLVDSARLLELAQFCEQEKFYFDHVFEDEGDLFSALVDVLLSAKTSPLLRDGAVLSCVTDRPQETSWAIITHQNAADFSVTKTFGEFPLAYRVNFRNEENDYTEEQITIYADGYSDDNPPEKVEEISLTGVTNHEHITKLVRTMLATPRLRPETLSFTQDMENIVYERGDLVTVQTDIMLWGKGGGRIVDTVTEESRVLLTVDEDPVQWNWGESNNIKIRTLAGQIESSVTWVEGRVLSVPVSAALEDVVVGDLFIISSQPFTDCIVADIQNQGGPTARVSVFEAAPGIHSAGEIPPFTANITNPHDYVAGAPPAPVVSSLRADETVVLRKPDGTLESRIELVYHLPGPKLSGYREVTTIEVQYRETAGNPGEPGNNQEHPWRTLPLFSPQQPKAYLSPVVDKLSYDVRVRAVNKIGVPSEWKTYYQVYVAGISSPPPDITDLSWENDSLLWSYSPPIDFAGFEVRHYNGLGGTWENASPIHSGLIRDTRYSVADVRGGQHTFFVKAKDVAGNVSKNAARVSSEFTRVEVGVEMEGGRLSPEGDWAVIFPGYADSCYVDTDGNLCVSPGSKTSAYSGKGLPAYQGATEPAYHTSYPRVELVSASLMDILPSNDDALNVAPGWFFFPDVEIEGGRWTIEYVSDLDNLWPADLAKDLWPSNMAQDLWPGGVFWQRLRNKVKIQQPDSGMGSLSFFGYRFKLIIYPGNEQVVIKKFDLVIDAPRITEQIQSLYIPDAYVNVIQTSNNYRYVSSVVVSLSRVEAQNPDAALIYVHKNFGENGKVSVVLGTEGKISCDGLVDVTIVGC